MPITDIVQPKHANSYSCSIKRRRNKKSPQITVTETDRETTKEKIYFLLETILELHIK